MKRKKIILLFLFAVFIFTFSSCHPRHVSDLKLNMTKEEVVSLWGKTDLITVRTVRGKPSEIWEYHFFNTDSICKVTFIQDRVVSTKCYRQPYRRPYYYGDPYYPYYYPYPYHYPSPYPYYYPYHHYHHHHGH